MFINIYYWYAFINRIDTLNLNIPAEMSALSVSFANSLKHTKMYFRMAVNSESIKDQDKEEFGTSWVAKNQICFLQDEKVKINFPTLPQMLREDIRKQIQDKKVNISHIPQVQGYILEEVFFDYAKQLPRDIVLCSKDSSISFKVNCVEQLGTNQESLTLGILYRLRLYHPVIDGVGVFSLDSKLTVLVFFSSFKFPIF